MSASGYREALAAGPDPAALEVARAFIEAPVARRYLFGATPYAAQVAEVFPVAGVIDDRTDATHHAGVRVLRSDGVPPDALVVSTIVGRIGTATRVLRALGRPFCDLFAFHRVAVDRLPPMRFVTGFHEAAAANMEALEGLRERMSDDRSREELDRLVRFRLSCDPRHLDGFEDRQPEQYFEPFLRLQPHGEVFADIGAFDGMTTEVFSQHAPGFVHAHLFEPDPANVPRIRHRFDGTDLADRIEVHVCALGEATATLRLASDASCSTLSDDGEVEVEVRRFDDVVASPVTFMKMDVEGAEAGAIRGGAMSIRDHNPRLAISAYHRADDLWALTDLVASIRDDHDLYLRHYTEGVVETVLFFMPRTS